MKKIWREELGRGGAPVHGSKSGLAGLVVLTPSLLLLLVLGILAIGLVLTILVAGPHLIRILIPHQAYPASADCSVPRKNRIMRKFLLQMGILRAAFLCYNEPLQLKMKQRGQDTVKRPHYAHPESKVMDSRPSDEGASTRRRRECLACHKRPATYETMESLPLVVTGKDGNRQTSNKSKLFSGMIRTYRKCPVPFGELEEIANEVEQALQSDIDWEIPPTETGELAMDRLREVDEVAYIRFASAYR